MSQINSIGSNLPLQPTTSPATPRLPVIATVAPRLADKLELSGISHLLTALKTNDIRTDKVATVRAQIEAGTYENDEKLDMAIDRLLDDLTR